jgi:alpha-1,3-rhamnosyl/mannosyltransferase
MTETCSPEPTGCGQFTRQAVQALVEANGRLAWGDAYTFWYRASKGRSAGHAFRPPGSDLRAIPRWGRFVRAGADIVHGFATHVPRLGSALRVVTLFDVFSALQESARWQPARSRRRKMRQYRRLARHVDLVLAASETTRRDFLAHFEFPAERVRVVYGGVRPAFSPAAGAGREALRARYDLPGRYFLYVGAPVPRKNVPRLIEAYGACESSREIGLVLAGSLNDEARSLQLAPQAHGGGPDVRLAGYVPDGDMPALYAGAEALLFPTFYEGFGMPVLEAMACGTPVLIGNRGAAPEVAGGHAVAVDPDDTDAIREGIERVTAADPARRRAAAAHAAAFTWERCAVGTREAYAWLLEAGGILT